MTKWPVGRGCRRLTSTPPSARGARFVTGSAASWIAMSSSYLPTTQVLPFDVREPFVREIAGTTLESYIDWMKSCYLISTLGHPAISVPCALVDGLPVGLQLVGRDGDDRGVLQLAHAFEEARGPFPEPTLASLT